MSRSWPATPPQLSATTLQREQHDPAVQLGHATARYLDALHVAAEHLADPQMITKLDHDADQLISGLTKEAAWPALRARLLLLMADDADPLAELRNAAQQLELDTAGDRAAVLDWRLDDTRLHNSLAPLPWLPGLPDRIANNPDWGPYLAARARLIIDLADQVRAAERAATWVVEQRFACRRLAWSPRLQVWRAAMQVRASRPPANRTHTTKSSRPDLAAPTGQATRQPTTRLKINNGRTCSPKQIPNLIKDSFLPSLAERLESLDRAGFDANSLVRSAAAKGPLPDDHPAAALWWRILDELPQRPPNNSDQPTPAVARLNATKPRREPHRAPQTAPSTIRPSR